MERLSNYVGGEFTPSLLQRNLESLNPSTGKADYLFPDGQIADVDAAVAAAQHAWLNWRNEPVESRAKWLSCIADAIESRAGQFAEAESRDQGKPLWLASSLDIPAAAAAFRNAAHALSEMRDFYSSVRSNHGSQTVRESLGVCGLIVPWNFPLMLLARKIAPAIAAGNCVVCKPSELTSLSAFRLAQLLREINLPPGVVNIVMGTGTNAGAAIVNHPLVRAISFTGGTASGFAIARESIQTMKVIGLEMGGKNPCLVFADANLDAAVASVLRSSFVNSGQVCLATSRLLVERSILSDFRDRLNAKLKKINVGDPMQRRTFMGPLISEAHRRRVQDFVGLAVADGLVVETGAELALEKAHESGFFMKPAVIYEPASTASYVQEELFGPVVTVSPFDGEDEAVAMANAVRYGLGAGIWTAHIGRAHRMATQLDAGSIWINSWLDPDHRQSPVGFKDSGYGPYTGNDSLEFFSKRKTVSIQY